MFSILKIFIALIDSGVIPAETDIVVIIHTLHRRKDIWGENADKFNPDHFLPENEIARKKYSYLPFSFGTRNCIGARYAMTNVRILIAHLLMNYKFTTSLKLEELEYGFALSCLVHNGNMVRIENR